MNSIVHGILEVNKAFMPLLVAAVWPVTIGLLVYSFRDQIRERIASLRKAEIAGNSMEFGEADVDKRQRESRFAASPPTERVSSPSGVNWQKVATIYWLGNDLDWTAQTALRNAPKERILHGLNQAEFHSSELGLRNSVPGEHLNALKIQVESSPESLVLNKEWRNSFAEQVYVVIQEFSGVMKEHQPDFRPGPKR